MPQETSRSVYVKFIYYSRCARAWKSEESWFDSCHEQKIYLYSRRYKAALGPIQPSING